MSSTTHCPPTRGRTLLRHGMPVLKALALGARFVFAGRPFAYAAAVAGQAGVAHAIHLLAAEVSRDMAMLGLTSTADSAQLHHVQRAHGPG
jgi:L-lactate dehydrogenase (cytochrome)